VNLWDVRLDAGVQIDLPLLPPQPGPEGHNAMIAMLAAHVTMGGQALARARSPASRATVKECVFARGRQFHPARHERRTGRGLWAVRADQQSADPRAIEDFNSGTFLKVTA